MSLVGVAVLGKSNEPLYMCSCSRLLNSPESAAGSPSSEGPDDWFELDEPSQTGPLYESLSLEYQFVLHAAIDRLEEFVEPAFADRQVAIRREASPEPGSHFLGVLLDVGLLQVYGYITATNIKFMALTNPTPDSEKIKDFLGKFHVYYVKYVMNAFNDQKSGPINSKVFDEELKQAVAEYQGLFEL